MAVVTGTKGKFTVKAYSGDRKTLLAFNFAAASDAANLAGFSVQCQPPSGTSYFLSNELQFEAPGAHAQLAGETPHSTANSPIQKYRWVHVPGAMHQGLDPVMGNYAYTVTPRYFDAKGAMQALDKTQSASVKVPVGPFQKGALTLGFTRGYMQSEAFAHHFGLNAQMLPAGHPLQFDTSATAGTNPAGQTFSFAEEYGWMGSTARVKVFEVLNAVVADPKLNLDVFAYDFNEPEIVGILLKLAAEGRVRVILDNAALHTNAAGTTPEDEFAKLFGAAARAPAALVRGSFNRYSHDKVLIVSKGKTAAGVAQRVLTGSTNFSVTGMYVNANHVLIFDDPAVASVYAKVFAASWQILSAGKTPSTKAAAAFSTNSLATTPFTAGPKIEPQMSITFSPHTAADADKILNGMADRVKQEVGAPRGNVIFAVMQLTGSDTPVYNTLNALHETQTLFSYGISDAPGGTVLYKPGTKTGVLVTGKPSNVVLPPPFDQVPRIPGHEIHDKFVICGLNGSNPVVYCGSSNLATGGEQANGDNLLAIHDEDVATAFAIEALLLVDHYSFLDRYAAPAKSAAKDVATTAPTGDAEAAAAIATDATAASGAAGGNGAKKRAPRKASASHRVTAGSASMTVGKKKALAPVAAKKAAGKKAAGKGAKVQTPLAVKASTRVRKASAKTAGVAVPASNTADAGTADGSGARPLLNKQPQSKQVAAVKAGIFLFANDSWSTRYFDPSDLHSLERELFG